MLRYNWIQSSEPSEPLNHSTKIKANQRINNKNLKNSWDYSTHIQQVNSYEL